MGRFRRVLLLLLAAAFSLLARNARAQSILTVAGGGTDDGQKATEVRLGGLSGFADAPDGTIWISQGATIRRVDPGIGRIWTVAGNGLAAFSGDGGPAREASISCSRILLRNGDVLFTDRDAGRIRRIDLKTLTIETWAGGGSAFGDGGPATQAQLSVPRALAVDAEGNVYVSDFDRRVRRIDAATGIVNTYAGDGSGFESGDGGDALTAGFIVDDLAVEPDGSLLIADASHRRIRRVDAATHKISTFAGDGTGMYRDGALATASGLLWPASVTVTPSGDVWIGDQGVVRRVARSTGRIETVLGAYSAFVVSSRSGGLLVADNSIPALFRYEPQTGVSTVLAGGGTAAVGDGGPAVAAVLSSPFAVAPLPDGSAVVAELEGDRVRRFRPRGDVETFAGDGGRSGPSEGVPATSTSFPRPSGLAADTLGNVYVLDRFSRVFRVDGSNGLVSRFAGGGTEDPGDGGPARQASLRAPEGIAYDGRGGLLLTESGGHRIRRVELASGMITTIAGTGTAGLSGDGGPASAARLNAPRAIAVDAGGNVYVADVLNYRIRRIAASDGRISTHVGGGTVFPDHPVSADEASFWPDALTSDAAGNLYIYGSSGPSSTVLRYDASTRRVAPLGRIETRPSFGGDGGPLHQATFGNVPWLALDAAGNLFVVEPASNRVRAVFACVTVAPPSLSAPADGATGVSTGPTLSWSAVPGAFRYDVYLGTASPPTTVAASDLVATSFTASNLSPGVRYFWKVVAATGAGLAITPYAFVSLKVGSSPDAVPQFRFNGVATEYAAFPGLSGPDDGRAPLSVDIHNPGAAPLELAAEVGPEVWLNLEPGWNASPIPPGGSRTLRLSTRRIRAPNGSALPRYTYVTLRTKGGVTSRLLVQDNEAPLLSSGRGASAVRPEASFLVPSVAHVTSALGNTFVSKVALSNAGTEAVQAELVFTPASSDSALVDGFDTAAIKRATLLVPPNDVVRLSDPLVLLFGLTPPVSGTLEVRAAAERAGFLSVASSVDAPASGGGSFGFALPVFRSGEGIRAGSSAAITAVASDAAERTNLILAETTGVDEARVRVSLYDASGALRGSETVTVPRWGQRQLSGVVQRLGGATGSRAGRIEVAVESGGGTLAAVTTVVDNANDDAAAFAARAVEATGSAAKAVRALAPAWAKATGTVKSLVPALVNGYQTFPASAEPFTFRSVLGFSNIASTEALFRLTYYDLTSGATIVREVRVPGRGSIEYTNALEQLFGIARGAKSQGPLFVESDPQGQLWCRVASSLVEGTIGDSFPVIPVPSEGLTGGKDARLIALDNLEQSVDRSRGTRSNLLLNEVAGKPVTLLVSLYEAGNRSSPIATRELSLEPFEKLQLSTVFAELGLESEERRKDRTGVLCTVRALSGEGLASAVVTTIDNKTGDTRNTLLAPTASGAPGVSIEF